MGAEVEATFDAKRRVMMAQPNIYEPPDTLMMSMRWSAQRTAIHFVWFYIWISEIINNKRLDY